MILTDLAKAKIKEIADGEGIDALSIRVSVKGGGCSGMNIEMEFDNSPSELDEIEAIDSITILIDPLSFQYLTGITMDFQEGVMTSGFKFIGGEVKSTCACGSSYSFESDKEEEENETTKTTNE